MHKKLFFPIHPSPVNMEDRSLVPYLPDELVKKILRHRWEGMIKGFRRRCCDRLFHLRNAKLRKKKNVRDYYKAKLWSERQIHKGRNFAKWLKDFRTGE